MNVRIALVGKDIDRVTKARAEKATMLAVIGGGGFMKVELGLQVKGVTMEKGEVKKGGCLENT